MDILSHFIHLIGLFWAFSLFSSGRPENHQKPRLFWANVHWFSLDVRIQIHFSMSPAAGSILQFVMAVKGLSCFSSSNPNSNFSISLNYSSPKSEKNNDDKEIRSTIITAMQLHLVCYLYELWFLWLNKSTPQNFPAQQTSRAAIVSN